MNFSKVSSISLLLAFLLFTINQINADDCDKEIFEQKFLECNDTAYEIWNNLADQKSKCCLGQEAAECMFHALDDIDCDKTDSKSLRKEIFLRYEDVHENNCHDYSDINGCYTPILGIILMYVLFIALSISCCIYSYMYCIK